jgi:hypothetical protein
MSRTGESPATFINNAIDGLVTLGSIAKDAFLHSLLPAPASSRDDNCGVCQESLAGGAVSNPKCNHVFHRECTELLLPTTKRCPFCRVEWLTPAEEETMQEVATSDFGRWTTESLIDALTHTTPRQLDAVPSDFEDNEVGWGTSLGDMLLTGHRLMEASERATFTDELPEMWLHAWELVEAILLDWMGTGMDSPSTREIRFLQKLVIGSLTVCLDGENVEPAEISLPEADWEEVEEEVAAKEKKILEFLLGMAEGRREPFPSFPGC